MAEGIWNPGTMKQNASVPPRFARTVNTAMSPLRHGDIYPEFPPESSNRCAAVAVAEKNYHLDPKAAGGTGCWAGPLKSCGAYTKGTIQFPIPKTEIRI